MNILKKEKTHNLEEILASLKIGDFETSRPNMFGLNEFYREIFSKPHCTFICENINKTNIVAILQQRIIPTNSGTESYFDVLIYDLFTKKLLGKIETQNMFSGPKANRYDRRWDRIIGIKQISSEVSAIIEITLGCQDNVVTFTKFLNFEQK